MGIPVVDGTEDFTNDETKTYLQKQKNTYQGLPKEGKSLIKKIILTFTIIVIIAGLAFAGYYTNNRLSKNDDGLNAANVSMTKQEIKQDSMFRMMINMNLKLSGIEAKVNSIDDRTKRLENIHIK